jgi:hypothetical protein
MAGYGTWQVAVESAQVLAGVVEYPRSNPFYMYHTKVWTLLHPLGALLLRAGLSEATVSLLVSGLLGMVSFAALTMTTFALCRDRWISLGVPFFIELTRAANFEIAYPIWILGSTHTYGVIGLSLALLVAALLGNGCFRSGAFALGLMPAIHPSIGAWTWIVVGLAVAGDLRGLRESLRRALPFFAAGAALTLTSLAVHLLVIQDVPAADAAASSRYLTAFVRLWDAHRRPIALDNPGVYVAAGALALVVFRLFTSGAALPREAALLLRILAVSGGLGLLFLAMSWVPPEHVPATLLVFMPSRLVNLIVLAAVPLLVGLLAGARGRAHLVNLAALLAVGVGLCQWVGVGYMRPNSNFHQAFHVVLWPLWAPVAGLGMSAAVLVGVTLAGRRVPPPEPAPPGTSTSPRSRQPRHASTPPRRPMSTLLRVVALGALGWAALVTARRTMLHWPARDVLMRDRGNDALLAEVSAQKGLLVTASDLHLIQLRTRRPVLIDGGGLDLLAYTLEAGPALEHVLRRVYGVDLFAPPPDAVMGTIPFATTRHVWESRPAGEWRAIGDELGATGVLAYADWRLQLPLVARDEELAFYRIGP